MRTDHRIVMDYKTSLVVQSERQMIVILRWCDCYVGKFAHTWNFDSVHWRDTYPRAFVFSFLREADCNMFGAVWQQSSIIST